MGSVLYMLSTYHLYKIYWLSAVGEYTAMAFLPLIPAALYELYGRTSADPPAVLRQACAELVVGFGMLLQVHLLSLEMAVLATAVFCLMRSPPDVQQGQCCFTWLKAAVLTVLLNLWFLVPFLTLMLSGDYNNMYTGSAENGGQIVKNSGLRIAELFGWQKNHNNLGPELLAGGFVLLWCWLTLRAKERTAAAGRREPQGYPPGALGRRVCGAGLLDEHEHFPVAGRGPHPGGGAYPGGNPVPGAVSFFGDGAAGTGGDVRVGGACGRSAMRGRWRCSLWGYRFSARRFSSATSRAEAAYLGDGGQLMYSEYKKFNMRLVL